MKYHLGRKINDYVGRQGPHRALFPRPPSDTWGKGQQLVQGYQVNSKLASQARAVMLLEAASSTNWERANVPKALESDPGGQEQWLVVSCICLLLLVVNL